MTIQPRNRTASAFQAQRAQAEVRHEGLSARWSERQPRVEPRSFGAVPRREPSARFGVRAELGTRSSWYLRGRYYDRPDLVRYGDRHLYMYYDHYNRLHHRVIWPGYYYSVYYPFGSYGYCDYVWPYYHRKYVFVSLGGWWPYDYPYLRYYWYGYHPYVWYGYYPVPYEVTVGGTDYYTYNGYYGDDGTYYGADIPMDPVTQARLRAQLEQQRTAEPAPQTLADTRFDEGVKSFEAGDYASAAAKFEEAMRLSPQDMVLPFAYAQALFAAGQYDKAADMLREALKNVTPEKQGVFFPRGLYANDDVLFAQVEKLVDKADSAAGDADLQLLLGYQLLGAGETGYAREALEDAAQDPQDAAAAGTLLSVLEKMEKEAGPATNASGGKIKMPEPKIGKPAATAATLGEMMSTAGTEAPGATQSTTAPTAPGAQKTPVTPAETVPPVPPQEKPDVQKEGSPNTGQESTSPVDESAIGPTQDTRPPAENNDNEGLVEAGAKDDGGVAVEKAGWAGGPVFLMSGLSRLVGNHAPNYKMDIGIFASILTLALAGVWIEWRFLGRKPV